MAFFWLGKSACAYVPRYSKTYVEGFCRLPSHHDGLYDLLLGNIERVLPSIENKIFYQLYLPMMIGISRALGLKSAELLSTEAVRLNDKRSC